MEKRVAGERENAPTPSDVTYRALTRFCTSLALESRVKLVCIAADS